VGGKTIPEPAFVAYWALYEVEFSDALKIGVVVIVFTRPPAREVAIIGQSGVGWHCHFTAGGAKPGTFDVHLGLTQVDHAALAAMPANFAGVAAFVPGTATLWADRTSSCSMN
jgi:hypothetical protein